MNERDGLINVLNLGAGVQSSTLLLMSIEGELPRLDHVIFADTGWEPKPVYQQMDWLEKQGVAAGIKVHRVSQGNIKDDCLRVRVNFDGDEKDRQIQRGVTAEGKTRWGSMPLFVLGPDGERGMIRRQCTYEYKIRSIERCLRRDILGLRPRQRAPKTVVVRRWIGISHDERQRMRISDENFAVNWYPLVENRITRTMCYQWLSDHGYHEAPRSACIGCPFHSNREWREMKKHRPEDWREAVELDLAIRNCGGLRGQVFLHSDRVPLDQANLWKDCDENQLPLFSMDDECMGMCGV